MKNSSTSNSSRWRPFLTGLIFAIGLFAIVYELNEQGRPPEDRRDIWYGPVVDYMKQGGRFNFLFVGTSRTRAAIRPDVFDTVMQRATGVQTVSINLGMGWCTLAEHYFGIRRLLEVDPGILKNMVVFIEAPSGLPEYSLWKSNWIVEDRTNLLTPYLHKSDLWRMWREATTSADMKFVITADMVAPFMEHIPRLRKRALADFDTLLQGIFQPVTGLAVQKKETSYDLVTEGGIRADARGVETARDLAIRFAREDLQNQPPWDQYDKTIVAEIVRMVKNAGGYVFFLDMPLSDVQQKPYDTPLRKSERDGFGTVLKSWNTVKLHPEFSCDSSDFPDLWHLRKSRAPEFTIAVAKAFLDAVMKPAGR